MKTELIPMPGTELYRAKFPTPGSAGNEKPAPAVTGTGKSSASDNHEAGQLEANSPQAGASGNSLERFGHGHNYRPVLWIPQVDIPLVAEIVRLEGESRAAEVAGHPREAARCYLLAVALTHSMARLACTGSEDLQGMRRQLAEDVQEIGEQVLDSIRGDCPAEIATGYQLDQSAHLYALAMLTDNGGRHA